ncbi:MAG: biotin transporter BioY, partial [Coriobacteriales bacterium]|nr:biotin transporter BioY [Coriobacteriales bacterium]
KHTPKHTHTHEHTPKHTHTLTHKHTHTPNSLRGFIPTLDVVSLALLSLIYYVLGCFWFMVSTNVGFDAALAACVLPFLLPDVLKAVVAFVCVRPVRAALGVSPDTFL